MSTKAERSPLSAAFGTAIRTMREKAGFSQELFAHQCGLDRAYYGLLERGGRHPTIKTVWSIANALGKRPRDLITATEKQMEVGIQQQQETATQQTPKIEKHQLRKGGRPGKRK